MAPHRLRRDSHVIPEGEDAWHVEKSYCKCHPFVTFEDSTTYCRVYEHRSLLKLEHEDAADCWCVPRVEYVDPVTGLTVYVHNEPEDSN